jgi:hypothetical protein
MTAAPTPATAASGLAAALRWPPGSGKFRLLAGILLALSAAYGAAYLAVAVGRGWPAGFGDSFALWSWGRFLIDHPAPAIYDPAALRPAQLALGMDPAASYPFGYPPSFLLVLWPLGRLSGPVACTAFMASSLALYLSATFAHRGRSSALIAALILPTTTIAVVAGQSGLLAAGLLAGGMRLAAVRPCLAGALLGGLIIKPQLGLLAPVALVAARLWRTLVAAGAVALGIVLLTSLLFGAAIWPAWVVAIPAFSRQFAAESGEIRHLMVTAMPALLQLGTPAAMAQLLQLAVSGAAAAIVWLLFRHGPSAPAAAGLLVAAPLATPYAFVYDLPVLGSALVWLVAERHRAGDAFGTGEVLVLMLALLAPAVQTAGTARLPIACLALALLLGLVVRRDRRLCAAARPAEILPAVC